MASAAHATATADEQLKARREALLKEYGEVASSFRLLSDIRFKLLALVPLATVISVFTSDKLQPVQRVALGVVGLSVLLGVITYNKRNDQLYDDLIRRAAAIERELGLPDGAFANRSREWFGVDLGLVRWPANHRFGVQLIYLTSAAAWLYMVLEAAVAEGACASSPWPHGCCKWGPMVVAASSTLLAGRLAAWQEDVQSENRRVAAIHAVEAAEKVVPGGLATHAELLEYCVELKAEWPSWRACHRGREKCAEKVQRRAQFLDGLERDPVRRRGYWPDDAGSLERAAYQVACLTDLPPGWLYDEATGRR